MSSQPPLIFHEPQVWKFTRKEATILPSEQKLVLPFARPTLLTWGEKGENSILQQVYEGPAMFFVMLTIRVTTYTQLSAYCHQAFTAFQYTLQGNTFGWLKGHGCLLFLEDTYTLQYVPQGTHQVLLPPGIYHYFYMIPGPSLNILAAQDPGIDQVVERLQTIHEEGKLASRLPMDNRIRDLLQRLLTLPQKSIETDFTVSAIIIKLLRHYHRQLQASDSKLFSCDTRSRIYTFLADHVNLPVQEVIKQLKDGFLIEGKPLLAYWKKSNAENLRSAVKRLRMHFALYLLVLEKLPVNEVADRLHYSDAFTFSKQFSRFYGVSPKQARILVSI